MPGPPLAKRLKRYLRYLAVRAAVSLVGLLPLGVAGALGERLGAWGFALAGGERRKALESLSRAFPALGAPAREALARQCFRHLGRAAFELACVQQIDSAPERWVEWPAGDRAVLDGALARGRGVVFVSGHVGNWELLARRVALAGYSAHTIAKETSDPRLTRLVERFRQRGRLQSIWRGQDGAAKKMLRVLREGAILGLLIDQDTRVQSVFVPFFGHPASTPRAAADLALRTKAALVVGFCQRQESGRYRIAMRELEVSRTEDAESDAVRLTAALTSEIEAAIRQAPAQWVWMHRRWKTQPE